MSTYHSSTLHDGQLAKEQLLQFFETVLVPHFFFNPAVFQDRQVYHFTPTQYEGLEAVSFNFSFVDHGTVKRLEGVALIKNQTLYIPFYLASEGDFDRKILSKFLKSFRLKARV